MPAGLRPRGLPVRDAPARPDTSVVARESAAASAASADDRMLRHLLMSLGPLGVPFPLLDFWRGRAGS